VFRQFAAEEDGASGILTFAYATNDIRVEAITKQYRMLNSNYPLNVTKVYMRV
jgi:hypothetical protein